MSYRAWASLICTFVFVCNANAVFVYIMIIVILYLYLRRARITHLYSWCLCLSRISTKLINDIVCLFTVLFCVFSTIVLPRLFCCICLYPSMMCIKLLQSFKYLYEKHAFCFLKMSHGLNLLDTWYIQHISFALLFDLKGQMGCIQILHDWSQRAC